ncbi:MAG: ribbon-helix-helix protein, CopG family [Calditrichaceae bacterium]
MSKNCISVHLSAELLEILNEQKIKTGLSQNRLIINLIEKGLDQTPKEKKPDQHSRRSDGRFKFLAC